MNPDFGLFDDLDLLPDDLAHALGADAEGVGMPFVELREPVQRCLEPTHAATCEECTPAPRGAGWKLGVDGPKRLRSLLLDSAEWNNPATLETSAELANGACVASAPAGSSAHF